MPPVKEGEQAIVYVLHFDRPLAHARHYIGITHDLEQRLKLHRRGHAGSRIMRVLKDRGIGFKLAASWPGTRADERKAKAKHGARWLCPICKAEPEKIREAEERDFALLPM